MSSEQTIKENLTMNARKSNALVRRLLTGRRVLVAVLFAIGALVLPVANASAYRLGRTQNPMPDRVMGLTGRE